MIGQSSAFRGLVALFMALSLGAPPARAQNVDVGGIIGTIMQGVIQSEMQERQRENERRSRYPDRAPTVHKEVDDDSTADTNLRSDPKPFAVDGQGLGDRVNLGHFASEYSNAPSEQFPGFQWYRTRRVVKSVATTVSILVSRNNEIAYYNKFYDSARFEPGAVQGEIKRISDLYQARPRIQKMARNGEGNSAVIAVWGSVQLAPLDAGTTSLLASGQTINSGILIDFLGDYRASAKRGLPVFKISGGAGYYWAARYNDKGEGTLRFGIADASTFDVAPLPPQTDTNPALAFSAVAPQTAVPSASPARDADAEAEANKRAEQAEAEAQAARDEATAKQRKAQFERASTAAKKVIDDASAFVKTNTADPKLLDYVQQISDLNSTLSMGNPRDTEDKTQSLLRSLQDDPEFSKFRTQRAEEKRRQIARDLGDAVHTLAFQRQFLIGVVTRDPTSSSAMKLLPLIKQSEGAIANPDLDRVQTLVGQIDAEMQNAGLTNEFVASQKTIQQQASTDSVNAPTGDKAGSMTAAATPRTGLQLVATDKNAFLLKGDLQDIVLMFNTSARAPHVVRNLRGEIVFNEGRADACLFGRDADDNALGQVVRSTVSAYATAKAIVLTDEPCDPDQLASYDVIATRRGTFLREGPQPALAMIKAIETDAYASLVTVTDAQVKAAASADAVAATEIAADVDKGVREGFGLLLLDGGSPAVCVVTQQQVEAHRQVLVGRAEKLARDLNAAPTLAPTSTEGAFVNAKRGQCGAIYARAADLKELAGALKRDGVAYRFSSTWVGTDEVKAVADKIQTEKDNAERQALDRQRRQADEQRVASLKAADEASKMAKLQAESRDKYVSSANAAQAKIAQDVKDFTDHPEDSSKVAARQFPAFAAFFRDALAGRWELMSENAELEDYGTSDFKGRRLNTPFTRITIELKNRMLGEYKSVCMIFGDIEDDEFAMRREPFLAPCDDDAARSQWNVQHAFQSVWKLQ